MLSDLIAGYSSSEGEGGEDGENKNLEVSAEKKVEEKPMEVVKPKKKLPSAAAMMASTSSWARGDEPGPAELVTDKLGKKYHNVAPPSELCYWKGCSCVQD